MTIDASLFPAGFEPGKARGRIAVVIDVLRSSATLTTALQNGARQALLFESPDEALQKRKGFGSGSVLLCGERGGKRIPGFDLGNSPAEYGPERVGKKTLLFTSTNGSKALLKAAVTAKQVLIAGFGNMTAVTAVLVREGSDCLLVCSGKEGRFSLEDAVCAGMLAERVRTESAGPCDLTDEAMAAALIYRHFKDNLLGLLHVCEHGQTLRQIGMEKDLTACSMTDITDVVPVYQNGILHSLTV